MSSYSLNSVPNSSSDSRCGSLKWESYSNALLDKNIVVGFGVYSRLTLQEWTSTSGFCTRPEQINAILYGFTDELQLRQKGIQLHDQSFTFTRMGLNRRVMVGRCTSTGAGCVLYLCQKCLLVAVCEPQQSSACFSVIEKMGDFLTLNNL